MHFNSPYTCVCGLFFVILHAIFCADVCVGMMIMITRDYIHAARRHLFTCQKLLEVANANIPSDQKGHILDNVYYLSGYVIETMLSYMLCSKEMISGDVMQSEHFKTTQFKTHNLNAKVLYLQEKNCNINGIVFISKKASPEQQRLFANWGAKYRYEKSSPCRANVDMDAYMANVQQLYNQILSKYPMS